MKRLAPLVLFIGTLTTNALAEDTKVVLAASKNIAEVKDKAGAWVTLGSYTHPKNGASTLQCKVAKAKIACQATTKGAAAKPIRVTSVNAAKGRVELAPDSMTLVLEIEGDLAGLQPHPWDS